LRAARYEGMKWSATIVLHSFTRKYTSCRGTQQAAAQAECQHILFHDACMSEGNICFSRPQG
jgi:hypothetical protein